MTSNRFREPMQNLYTAHQEFQNAWATGQTGVKGKEKEEVTVARRRFRDATNVLFQTRLDPLRKHFLTDSSAVIDDVIDFLAVDIPAFRCGYEKEWYLRRLKSLPLSTPQQERLKSTALDLCSGPGYRREITEWGKLMIGLADSAFVDRLLEFVKSPDKYVRKKAERMSSVILENRNDLKGKHRN